MPNMQPNRWFFLRHAEGFTPDHFGCVEAGAHIWAATVRANIDVWDKVPGRRNIERPTYEFGPVALSDDRAVVTIPLGGDPRYIGLKLFEDQFPWEFTHLLPMWFRLDLEHGRKDTSGWFPETKWAWFYEREKADELRKSYAFTRPETGA